VETGQTLNFAAGIIRRHRIPVGSLWRKLNPGQQALLVLVCLRKGETSASLAAGFGVGTPLPGGTCPTFRVALLRFPDASSS
jgi:hypothetical protein